MCEAPVELVKLHELAERFDRSVSWVSRRLASLAQAGQQTRIVDPRVRRNHRRIGQVDPGDVGDGAAAAARRAILLVA